MREHVGDYFLFIDEANKPNNESKKDKQLRQLRTETFLDAMLVSGIIVRRDKYERWLSEYGNPFFFTKCDSRFKSLPATYDLTDSSNIFKDSTKAWRGFSPSDSSKGIKNPFLKLISVISKLDFIPLLVAHQNPSTDKPSEDSVDSNYRVVTSSYIERNIVVESTFLIERAAWSIAFNVDGWYDKQELGFFNDAIQIVIEANNDWSSSFELVFKKFRSGEKLFPFQENKYNSPNSKPTFKEKIKNESVLQACRFSRDILYCSKNNNIAGLIVADFIARGFGSNYEYKSSSDTGIPVKNKGNTRLDQFRKLFENKLSASPIPIYKESGCINKTDKDLRFDRHVKGLPLDHSRNK